MRQSIPFQAANHRSPLRIGQIIFTVLTLLTFALGSLLLSLAWLGGGITTSGKVPGADGEGRAFILILIWPVTMLAVWILSTIALLLAKRWILASLSLPAAFAIFYGVWFLMARFMLTTSGVMFTALFILLNTSAIWLASWFLRSRSR